MPTPGQRWRAAREAAGLNVQEAARVAEVHRNTIYDLEKDDEGVTLRIMNKVADVYGITLAEIFSENTSAERVPAEFRPLLEPLLPFSPSQREKIVRNVAANLSFMGVMYGAIEPAPSAPGAKEKTQRPERSDRLGVIPGL